MLRVLLEAAERLDEPLMKLNYAMCWGIEFTALDIENIKTFVQSMDPMERLFSSLKSEKESTIHLSYPTVLVTLTFKLILNTNMLSIGVTGQSLSTVRR